MDQVKEMEELIGRDLPEDFITSLENQLAWGADTAWREIMEPRGIGTPPESVDDMRIELEILRRNRRALGSKALLKTAQDAGIPRRYINVGGGHKAAFAQFGNIIVGTEPTDFIGQLPPISEHRIALASHHYHLLQQLEFQFSDSPVNRIDTRESIFVIIQHGVSLASLERHDCLLAHMALIVPTRDLKGLVVSANIMGEGFRKRFIDPIETAPVQVVDRVHPKIRTRRKKINGGDNG